MFLSIHLFLKLLKVRNLYDATFNSVINTHESKNTMTTWLDIIIANDDD